MCNSRNTITPKCIVGEKIVNPFVELDGTFVPCCWMTSDIDRIDLLKKFYGNNYNKLNLNNNSIQDIKKQWDKIADSWDTVPFETCMTVCGEKNDQ